MNSPLLDSVNLLPKLKCLFKTIGNTEQIGEILLNWKNKKLLLERKKKRPPNLSPYMSPDLYGLLGGLCYLT